MKDYTVFRLLQGIEKQVDEEANSYQNQTYILVLLDLLQSRLYFEEPELSYYCKLIIKKILGE
jgi:hypothetical protein